MPFSQIIEEPNPIAFPGHIDPDSRFLYQWNFKKETKCLKAVI